MELPGVKSRRGDGNLSGDGGAEEHPFATKLRSAVARCRADEHSSNGGVEYPCVRRFRHRRLITYLWLQGFEATLGSMLGQSDAIFSVRHLNQMVLRGQWGEAYGYLSRFLPLDTGRPPSVEALVVHRFVKTHRNLADVVAGTKEGDSVVAKLTHYLDHRKTLSHGAFRLRSIILNVLHSRQHLRTSLDWECVRRKATLIIHDLVYRTPELKELVFMPRGPMRPLNVLPIGFGFRRRCHWKKQSPRPSKHALFKYYLGKRMSLPASSSRSQESVDGQLTELKAIDWVADILDESLKAGIRPELHQARPVQTSCFRP